MGEDLSKRISEIVPKFLETYDLVHEWEEFGLFERASKSLLHDSGKIDKFLNIPDPRFNSISWARDVDWLIDQVYFSFYWMDAFAKYFEEKHDSSKGPYGDYWPASYYADNCMLGIYSCRDKIALMVWAFYCPFDITKKEEVLDFHKIMKRLNHPVKYAIKADDSQEFWNALNGLNDSVFNKEIAEYRHKKIHRREPKIIMGPIENCHFRDYTFPVLDPNEEEEWKNQMKAKGDSPQVIESVMRNSVFDGVMYRRKSVNDLLVSYSDVKDQIERAFKKTLKVAVTCFDILDSRLFPK
ncbi:hypothetical protein NITGR_410010 [Nitrospina gracilis 3/211]|uniref:Cthe-2314-like HEPN domain-containing protein n=1 Tax=Nitrospina gracilis (strain 3/211) TaxID=1266370 RepID=M1YZA7_NITG3|nr:MULTISPECIES: Cthe_2314 family HEPN domain-containing protein [Nitrospina]MCF8723726.1 hypothetical protein [Nitrospina sp. Nb-3]CCQ90824.1 hypothetical protein NITGR_410010 [Nitrospina gracilis 3/211]